MVSADGRYVLAFNGEIYNFRDLKQTLESRGHRFRTTSDTEVLLQWLACHWRDGLADLNGMFAFALWDRREKRLLLARDRLGIKPLYVYENDGRFAFASEIKALGPVVGRLNANLHAVFQWLTFQNSLTEQTFFKDVVKLAPGDWIEWSSGGTTAGRFWTLAYGAAETGDFDDLVRTYRDSLERSVVRHMIADVPVGSYLSGG